jgi:hypothetical protein
MRRGRRRSRAGRRLHVGARERCRSWPGPAGGGGLGRMARFEGAGGSTERGSGALQRDRAHQLHQIRHERGHPRVDLRRAAHRVQRSACMTPGPSSMVTSAPRVSDRAPSGVRTRGASPRASQSARRRGIQKTRSACRCQARGPHCRRRPRRRICVSVHAVASIAPSESGAHASALPRGDQPGARIPQTTRPATRSPVTCVLPGSVDFVERCKPALRI